MIWAKLATLGQTKINVFLNKYYGVITSDYDVTSNFFCNIDKRKEVCIEAQPVFNVFSGD